MKMDMMNKKYDELLNEYDETMNAYYKERSSNKKKRNMDGINEFVYVSKKKKNAYERVLK